MRKTGACNSCTQHSGWIQQDTKVQIFDPVEKICFFSLPVPNQLTDSHPVLRSQVCSQHRPLTAARWICIPCKINLTRVCNKDLNWKKQDHGEESQTPDSEENCLQKHSLCARLERRHRPLIWGWQLTSVNPSYSRFLSAPWEGELYMERKAAMRHQADL